MVPVNWIAKRHENLKIPVHEPCVIQLVCWIHFYCNNGEPETYWERQKKTSTFLSETKETEKQGVSPWVCGEGKGSIRQLVADGLLILKQYVFYLHSKENNLFVQPTELKLLIKVTGRELQPILQLLPAESSVPPPMAEGEEPQETPQMLGDEQHLGRSIKYNKN